MDETADFDSSASEISSIPASLLSTGYTLSDDFEFCDEDNSASRTPGVRARKNSSRTSPESVFRVADIVLKNQTAWLIEHAGVHEDFEEVVEILWFSYLSKSVPDVSEGFGPMVAKNSPWLNTLRQADFAQLLNCPSFKLKGLMEEARREFEASGESSGHPKISRGRPKNRTPKAMVFSDSRYALRLTMPKILSIIGIALHITGESTLISDLIFWIKSMQFPYLNHELTNKEMISLDLLVPKNTSYVPEYEVIEPEMTAVWNVIFGNDEYGITIPLLPLIDRFVEELNLPFGLIRIASRLAESMNMLDYEVDLKMDAARRASNRESSAMACIVYSMILLFGMDDQTEVKISAPTRKIQDQLPNSRLFDYQKWTHYIDQRRIQLFRHTVLLPKASIALQTALLEKNRPATPPDSDKAVLTYYGSCEAEFQTAFRNCEIPGQETPVLILDPCHRPFRAHTHELSKTCPPLSVDFSSDLIEHLMVDRKGFFRPLCSGPEVDEKVVFAELKKIYAAQNQACRYAFPLRGYNIRGSSKRAVMENVPSFSLRWLITICAEMIAHKPEALLGEILFLELGLFPKNCFCRIFGKGAKKVKKMRE